MERSNGDFFGVLIVKDTQKKRMNTVCIDNLHVCSAMVYSVLESNQWSKHKEDTSHAKVFSL